MQIQISGSELGPKVDGEYVLAEEKFNEEDQFRKSDDEGTWLFYAEGHWIIGDAEAKSACNQAGAGGLEEKDNVSASKNIYFRSAPGAAIPNELSTEEWSHESDDHILKVAKVFAPCIHVKAFAGAGKTFFGVHCVLLVLNALKSGIVVWTVPSVQAFWPGAPASEARAWAARAWLWEPAAWEQPSASSY